MNLLEVDNLHAGYGAIQALRGISLHVEEGEIVTLIGSNGAGKSTLMRVLSGIQRPFSGEVRFHAAKTGWTRLDKMPPHRIVRSGVAQVPEGRLIFQNLTVRENLDLGAYARTDGDAWKVDLERVYSLFPRLQERRKQNAGTLSGGEQQMLAIGRALMSSPRLLILDEPSLGLAPALTQQIFAKLVEINRSGTTLFIVEQDAYLALETAHRGYVLETGSVMLSGPCSELLKNPEIKTAYLGG